MTIRIGCCILLMFFLASGCLIAQGQVSNPNYKPLRLPSGEVFPSSEAELFRMRDKPDGDAIRKMRAHAWDIFAGLVGGEQPIWDTWYTKCDLHLELAKCTPQPREAISGRGRLLQSLEIPAQSLNQLEELVPDSKLKASSSGAPAIAPSGAYEEALADFIRDFRKKQQLASVLFNQEASDNVTNNCLYPQTDSATPNTRSDCPSVPTAPGKVASFPRGAVVLKTVWALVGPKTQNIVENDTVRYAYLAKLWNEIHSEKDKPNAFERQIRVDFTGGPCKGDYADNVAIPLDCFYHSGPLTKDDLKIIPKGLVHLVSAGAWAEGNYLVLLGMHLTTKEIGDWVWATFWWDNQAGSDWHANGRPKTLGSPWNHYLMDTTLSGTTPVEQDGGPKICFNPFLETDSKIPHGIISNCLQCHSKAAFGTVSERMAYKLGVVGRDGQRLASGDHPMPEYFDSMVSTDFLWSIAEAQSREVKRVLTDLQFVAQDLK